MYRHIAVYKVFVYCSVNIFLHWPNDPNFLLYDNASVYKEMVYQSWSRTEHHWNELEYQLHMCLLTLRQFLTSLMPSWLNGHILPVTFKIELKFNLITFPYEFLVIIIVKGGLHLECGFQKTHM